MGNDINAKIQYIDDCTFNPRSRVGNDAGVVSYSASKALSIHVPAWGTTGWHFLLALYCYTFNPRSRVGNDNRCSAFRTFLSAFNPRSRVGNDTIACASPSSSLCFQSTFPRGERPSTSTKPSTTTSFQSTFPRGERRKGQG